MERKRLDEERQQNIPWKKWGPYLSERQWGMVREDYSKNGDAWDYFTHDQARSSAYRWGEDGMGGICDTTASSVSLWPSRTARTRSSRNVSSSTAEQFLEVGQGGGITEIKRSGKVM